MEQTMLLKNIHDIFNAVPADPLRGFLFFFVRLRQMTPIQNDVPRYSIEKNKPDSRMFPHHCSTLRPGRFSGWNSKFSHFSMVVWQILCRIVRRYLSIWTEAGCSVNPDMIFQWGWSDLLKSKSTGDFEILIYMMQKSPLSAQNDV